MKIFVIGDSISVHYGPSLEKYLHGFCKYERRGGAKEAMQNLDIPAGSNGGDSSMVLTYLQAKKRIDADYLLLNCGLHDIKTNPTSGKKQIPLEEYKRNLQNIINFASTMPIKLIWIRTTPCDEAVHNNENSGFYRFASDCNAYNQAADEIMSNSEIPIIDLHTFTLNLAQGAELYCDHVHFPEHIREKQGAFIAGWVSTLLS